MASNIELFGRMANMINEENKAKATDLNIPPEANAEEAGAKAEPGDESGQIEQAKQTEPATEPPTEPKTPTEPATESTTPNTNE